MKVRYASNSADLSAVALAEVEAKETDKALAEYLFADPLLRRFFETFLFERDIPASDRRPDEVYLDEVRNGDLYLGLFGNGYGRENKAGLSPTHLEYNEATRLGKTRLIFVRGMTDDVKHPKMRALINDAGDSLIRRRFNSVEELIAAVYASLVRILEERELIRFGPFDATFCRNATLDDLDEEKIIRFLVLARRGRHFPLPMAAVEEQFRRMVFNIVARNQDDHVKKFAFLMDRSGAWSLSPAFDMTYSYQPSGK